MTIKRQYQNLTTHSNTVSRSSLIPPLYSWLFYDFYHFLSFLSATVLLSLFNPMANFNFYIYILVRSPLWPESVGKIIPNDRSSLCFVVSICDFIYLSTYLNYLMIYDSCLFFTPDSDVSLSKFNSVLFSILYILLSLP